MTIEWEKEGKRARQAGGKKYGVPRQPNADAVLDVANEADRPKDERKEKSSLLGPGMQAEVSKALWQFHPSAFR